ncbi:transposase [Candidatus Aminicenantes bacterium AC-334-K16]|nr:transposase [Candidatus Aminicenantes bacterium AC-334-K16]
MGRIARVVIPNYPHHVIQRGNRRQVVFFHDDDKKLYLQILNYHCRQERVKIWCYCLMDNHVHLIAVPSKSESLAKAIGETHKKYTSMINIRHNWRGHLWQGRFLSYPMDERYLYLAVRYIERNPVRAGIVRKAEDYLWSSAKAHVFKVEDKILSEFYLTSLVKDWSAYLQGEDKEDDLRVFRSHEKTGRPLGSEKFLEKLEMITGRKLKKGRPGRPKK